VNYSNGITPRVGQFIQFADQLKTVLTGMVVSILRQGKVEVMASITNRKHVAAIKDSICLCDVVI